MTAYPRTSGLYQSQPYGQGFWVEKPLDDMGPHERVTSGHKGAIAQFREKEDRINWGAAVAAFDRSWRWDEAESRWRYSPSTHPPKP